MHHYRRLVTAGPVRVAVLCALLAMQPNAAWAQPVGARYQVEQPAQPLSEALKAIASQTNISVLFDAAVVGKRLSRPVAGQFTGAEAISKALEGSGLTAEVMRDGSVVVKPGAGPGAGQGGQGPGSQVSGEPMGVASANTNSPTPPIQLAQAQAPAQGASDAGTNKPPAEPEGAKKLPTVEVTGSRIKRVELDGALPVNVYTREDIDKSGQPTLGTFLNSLNEVSMGSPESGIARFGGQTTVQLRGLPPGSTLVLLNGRRTGVGGQFFNLDLIPFAAVERIEIIPVGSSAVYGGDALAGVVNVILKKSADGLAVDAVYGHAEGTDDGALAVTAGGQFDRGSFLLLAAFSKKGRLHAGERDLFTDADYRRFGGPDARSRSCTPGTVTSATAANLPGLNSTLAGIPSIAPGQALTIADFTATAGLANLCSNLTQPHGFSLIIGTETAAVHGAAEYRVGNSWSAFGEVTLTDFKADNKGRGITLSNVLVPASNAFNPFGVAVRVSGRLGLENGQVGDRLESDFYRALVGLRGDIGKQWELEATLSTNREKSHIVNINGALNAVARTAALAASTPAAALNPFSTGRAASDDVLRGIWSDQPSNFVNTIDILNAFVRGPALQLPAGKLDLLAGFDLSRDELDARNFGSPQEVTGRRVKAVFAETRVPILSSALESGRTLDLVALTLAGRTDSYSDFGDDSTYQVGLEVRPARSTLLRAAHATSFKPPTVGQMTFARRTALSDGFLLTDPRRNNELIVGATVDIAPNRDLGPETGEAQTLGVVWEPDLAPGLRLGLNSWKLKVREQIILPTTPQFFLNSETLLPGYITRGAPVGGAPGPVTGIFYTVVNIGRVDIAGTDFDAAYSRRAALGRWHLSASATRTSEYEAQVVATAPIENRLGKLTVENWAPKWKGRISLALERNPWEAGISGRYVGKYTDAGTSTRTLGDFWYADLHASADLKRAIPSVTSAVRIAKLSVVVANVGNKLPEFANTVFFHDFTQADIRGRYFTTRLSVAW